MERFLANIDYYRQRIIALRPQEISKPPGADPPHGFGFR